MTRFLFALAVLLSGLFTGPAARGQDATTAAAYPRPFSITPEQKARLIKALAGLDRQYDPQERMLKSAFSSPGYHTTLTGGTVHSTRGALEYAVALLDTGDPERLLRAEEILRRMIGLQDQDPQSKTYGIWSWFLEEPLAKMSPPDWNWADFCGVQLLQVALDHRGRLPADLARQVDESIQHAARAIRKRNVGPDYTNIAVMGTYVTLVSAELYHDDDLKAYAMARLKRFYDYTLKLGGFTEYNSPTYTVVALSELGRMRLHVRDAEARAMVEKLYHMAWEEFAQHFHPPTQQWAGPHSRAYRALLGTGPLELIERATEGRVTFAGVGPGAARDEARLPLPCPRDLEPLFRALDAPRTVVKRYSPSNPPVIGTTYLAPRLALGTVNFCDLWNQRHDLIAYWGPARQPGYLHLRLLKNGYDLAAGEFCCVQQEGRALAGINLASDGGDTHISLDKLKNGLLKAKDLRLRFELGGAAGQAAPAAPASLAEPARLNFGDVTLDLCVPFAKLGDATGHWAAGQDPKLGTAWLDIVLYEGEKRPLT